MKLDKKDMKILHQLDVNARQPNSSIAKAVKLSKDAVGYRIRYMEQSGIIRGYTAVIDCTRLGYIFYRVLFRLIDINPKEMKRMISFLEREKNVWWIATLDGAWDFVFAIWVKNNNEFMEFFMRFVQRFRRHIKESLVCPLTAYKQFDRAYLVGKRCLKPVTIADKTKVKFDEIDIKILNILSNNSRIRTTDIANKLKYDSASIFYRIKNLEKRGIIQGYKVNLSFDMLKRDFYSVKINLNNMHEIKQIENYVVMIPETVAIINAVGSYDFEFDMEVRGSERYFNIIDELRNRFSSIREILYFRVLRNYKVLYMPGYVS